MTIHSPWRYVAPMLVLAASASAAAPEAHYDGLVRPSRDVWLNAPLEGVLDHIAVEEGQRVDRDMVLAKMDDRLQQLAVEAAQARADAEAEIRGARHQLEEAQILLDRAEEAHEADAASEWEVRRARVQRDQAQAQLDATIERQKLAQIELRLEQQRLERYELAAPFDGVVVEVEAEPGQTMRRDGQILRLVSLQPLEAVIHLPAELYGQMQLGRPYTLHADEPAGAQVQATLKVADPVIDPASNTFRCVFEIANADGALPSGFLVHLPHAAIDQPE